MINLGADFLDQPGVFVPGPDIIAILYQLNTLIIPTLAPVLLWAWQSRDAPMIRNLFHTLMVDPTE